MTRFSLQSLLCLLLSAVIVRGCDGFVTLNPARKLSNRAIMSRVQMKENSQQDNKGLSGMPGRRRQFVSIVNDALTMALNDGMDDGVEVPGGAHHEKKVVTYTPLALLGLSTKWVVSYSIAAVLLIRRDPITMAFVVGAMLNGIVGKILKRIINESRPVGAKLSDPGMPSSHGMSLCFIGASAALALAGWDILPSWWPSGLGVYQSILAMLVYIVAALSWRVKEGLHTTEQILAGAGFGLTDAYLWHTFGAMRTAGLITHISGPDPLSLQACLCVCGVGLAGVSRPARSAVVSLWKKVKPTK